MQQITQSQIAQNGGWIPVLDSWAYASANTITVPSGAASLYQKGDRIKWTQTTVKYGVIIAVADTLITIAVNTSYTVANAAITDISYSHQMNPMGYPHWFNTAAPTWGSQIDNGSGGQPTTTSSRFKIDGNMATVVYKGNGVKNALGGFFNLNPSAVYPVLANTNYSIALGSANASTANFDGGMIKATSAINWEILLSGNISDNVTISSMTFIAQYEI